MKHAAWICLKDLRHNTTYDLARVSGDVGWHFDGPNSIITEVPFEGELQVGFRSWTGTTILMT